MDHDYQPSIFGIIFLSIIGLLQYFAGKHAGRQETIEEVRDLEIAELRRKIEEFQRAQRY